VSETAVRLLIVGVVLVAILVAARRSASHRRARPRAVSRKDLLPGIYLFSSTTCETCREARRVLDRVYPGRYQEVRFDDDPAGFGGHEILRVPTVLVVTSGGNATSFEGVPRPADLRSAAELLGDGGP
jgi:hypothetical protein